MLGERRARRIGTAMRMQGALPRPESTSSGHRALVSSATAHAFARVGDDRAGRAGGAVAGRGQGRRLASGAHGVRAARARRPLDPRRSALADDAERMMNLKIKFRESFRPFAPACCASTLSEWFDLDRRQPLHAAGGRCAARAASADDRARNERCSGSTSSTCRAPTIPAVTHVDYSARVQTVHADTNPLLPRAAQPVSTPRPAAR